MACRRMNVPMLLFAAGLGTRMAPLTNTMPKPLIKVGNTTLLDHALDLTVLPAISRRVVNVHYKADQIRTHLADTQIGISDEIDLLRDTGGGLKHALPALQGDPVATMNTDAVWQGPNPVLELLAAWQDHMQCLLLLIAPERCVGHRGKGDFVQGKDGRLSRGPGAVYAGLQITRTGWIDQHDEQVFSMNKWWDVAMQTDDLHGVIYSGHWCDVGQPDSIPLAEKMMASHV